MSKHSSNAEVLFPSEDESMTPLETHEDKKSKRTKAAKTSRHSTKPANPALSSSSEDESSPQLDSKKNRSASCAARKSHHSSKPALSSSSEDEPSSQHNSNEKKKKRSTSTSATSALAKKRVKISPVSVKPRQSTASELFGSDSDDVQPSTSRPCPGKLLSYITRRLANEYSRQSNPTKTGSHYVDLKVYKCNEIEKVLPVNRWRQSIVTVKTHTDDNTEAWQHLANFITAIRKEYRTCTPTFVSNYY